MGEQIVLVHLHGVSAAQMTLRLGPLPLAKPAVGTPSPSKSGQWEAQAWQCHEHLWVQRCGGMRLRMLQPAHLEKHHLQDQSMSL